MDHEDYAFVESEIPYSKPRLHDECVNLILSDIDKYGSFVLCAVTGDFGNIIPEFYILAVYVSAPHELRMKRIEQRTIDQHGDRARKGGDMHEQQLKFADFAAKRPLNRIDQWAKTLSCPIIRVDGAKDWRNNAVDIAAHYYKLKSIEHSGI